MLNPQGRIRVPKIMSSFAVQKLGSPFFSHGLESQVISKKSLTTQGAEFPFSVLPWKLSVPHGPGSLRDSEAFPESASVIEVL